MQSRNWRRAALSPRSHRVRSSSSRHSCLRQAACEFHDGVEFRNDQSALIFASRTTLLHLAISALMRAPNCSGVSATGTKPSASRRCLSVGRCDHLRDGVVPAFDHLLRRSCRRDDAGERVALEIGNARFRVGRHVRQGRRARRREHRGPRRSLPSLICSWPAGVPECDRRVAPDRGVDGQRRAIEGYRDEV